MVNQREQSFDQAEHLFDELNERVIKREQMMLKKGSNSSLSRSLSDMMRTT
jgi:hypothetical protein